MKKMNPGWTVVRKIDVLLTFSQFSVSERSRSEKAVQVRALPWEDFGISKSARGISMILFE
jgi:hypothetical protein